MKAMRVDSAEFDGPPKGGFRETSDDLSDLLDGAQIGLALFDSSLVLTQCNARYRALFDYGRNEAKPGTKLEELVRLNLSRRNDAADQHEKRIDLPRQRVQPGMIKSFHYATARGRQLVVTRKCLQNGKLIETVRDIDETREAHGIDPEVERLADLARERLSHALESMADGFALYDADDCLVIYNQKYIEYHPHIADIILPGRSFESMLRTAIERNSFNTGDLTAEEFMAWRLKMHRECEDPYDIQLADGRWIRVHEKRTEDGSIVGIRSDITEMKNREADMLRMSQELRRKNIQFDTALNNMVQGICMFDDEQTLIVCNRRYIEMYGFDPNIVKPGIKLREIMEYSVSLGNYADDEAAAAITARPDHAKLRETATLKQRLCDGRVIAVIHRPMPHGGSIATYLDITDLERNEERLRDYTRRLEISNRELQDFAHIASHDLQEPLRKIEAFGSRLSVKLQNELPDDLSNEATMFLDRMMNAASRMRSLIEDLLNFSRITTRAQPFMPVDLNVVIAGVLSDMQVRVEDNDAKIVIDSLPTIDADGTQMRQLLQNLIGNALKFCKDGRRPEVHVTARVMPAVPGAGASDLCQLQVSDNGIGFDERYSSQIFTIFQRLHGRNEYEGTGIGLATCKKIVERHGGLIEAVGRPDEGAVFTVTLPVSQESKENEHGPSH